MPEGDTIRRLAEKITARFAGQRCVRSVTRDPRLTHVDFAGAVLTGADAVGKHLFIRFDDGRTLYAHLRLTGSFVVGPAASEPAWRRRVELWMEDGRLTGVDVPILGVVADRRRGPHRRAPRSRPVRAEPPDLDEVTDRLQRESETCRSPAPCSTSATSPGSATSTPSSCRSSSVSRRTSRSGRSTGSASSSRIGTALIRTNAARGPQNTTGRRLTAADHWIYARRGRPCPLCGTRLDGWDNRDSPWQRLSTWCPACQPLEARRAVDLERAHRLLALHPARKEPTYPRLGGPSKSQVGSPTSRRPDGPRT